jgi:hypothetical protein
VQPASQPAQTQTNETLKADSNAVGSSNLPPRRQLVFQPTVG